MEQEEVWYKIAETWSEYRKRAPDEIIEFLKDKKGKIIDLGCGSGRNLIANSGIKYYGVDFSEEMLKIAERNARDKKINAVFFKSSLDRLPFEDDFFDSAIFISTLHCIETPELREKALKELYRVMKKGSEIMISVWNRDKNQKLSELKAKEGYLNFPNNGKNYQRYYYFYEEDELKNILEGIGFKVIRTSMTGDEKHAKKNFIFYVRKQ